MYYDTHCHLNLLNKKELEQAITDAKEKNVKKMISCSTSFQSNKQNLLLSKTFPEIKAGIGLYPLDILELNDEELNRAFGYFKKQINNAIAIGEIGLDYKYCKTQADKEKQKEVFVRFIELGKEFNKPLIIHSRYATRNTLELLENEGAEKVLLHSFTESKKLMDKASENGWYVGCGVNVIFNEQVQNNIKEFPIENLLFETDSPIKFNGERAMPKDIVKIAAKVGELKNLDIDEIQRKQEENYSKLFRD